MNALVLVVLAALVVAVGVLLWMQRRRQTLATSRQKALEELDTVAAWPPESTRLMSSHERKAYAILARALPEYIVLAQVPFSRFLRVPTRYSYSEWLRRIGAHSADLLVCDRASDVKAVIQIRTPKDSERAEERHKRIKRVLKAAKIQLVTWRSEDLPTPEAAREALVPQDAAQPEPATHSPLADKRLAPTPLSALPVADVDETPTQPGDLREPPPSTWFDDLDQPPSSSRS